jgi:hypothetical protein
MMKSLAACAIVVGLLGAASTADAAIAAAPFTGSNGAIVLAADGCGPGRYRGPGGACHRFGYGPGPVWSGPRSYCGGHRAWVQGPYGGWHWGWMPNC